MQILAHYRINYMYIFEINPASALSPYQMYSFTLRFSFILFLCCLLASTIFRIHDTRLPSYKLPIMIMSGCFGFIMFCPLNFFYRNARWTLIKCIAVIMIAPFSVVKFRHFFFANIITSTNQMMYDTADMICFYQHSGPFKGKVP